MTDMTQDDLARAVAAEMGGDVAAETEKALRGETSRAFGIGEAMAVAGFIAQCAQIGLMLYQSHRDSATLTAKLVAAAPASPRIDDAKRGSIIRKVLAKLTGA